MPIKDLTNQKFGFLVALEGNRDLSKKDRSIYWKCICECGNFITVRSSNLISGSTKSCGCQKDILHSQAITLPKGEVHLNQLYKNYKASSKRRKLPFLLSKENFQILINGACYFCGTNPNTLFVIKNIRTNNSIYYNGVDRLDNNIGYLTNNCVSCCKFCNFAKRELTVLEFLHCVEKIFKHSSERGIIDNTESII